MAKRKKMKTPEISERNSEKISSKQLWTRILCLFLAFMMVAGSVYVLLDFILH